MYPVSQDFKDAIYADTREMVGRVTFDISPVNIENDIPAVTFSSEFFYSLASTQISDNVRIQTLKLITNEDNRTVLDGSWSFASDTSSDWGQVGWVSSNLSDASKNLSASITLTYASSYTSSGVTVTFDPLNGEYATDFTVTAYNAANAVVYTTNVTGNTLTQYVLSATISNFKKITIQVSKWSVAYRRARIVEIDPGQVIVFTDDNLIRFSMSEEMDPVAATMPIPEFEFTVDNTAGTFNILNPSGIYASLEQRQRIQPELGLNLTTRTEYVPLGTFYLSEWRVDQGALTATFRGRSKIDLLDLKNYSNSVAKVSYSLYDMAVDILTAAGVSGYNIDTALQSISTNGLIVEMTCREALQMVCIAGCATIKIDRSDVLRIKTTRETVTTVNYVDFSAMLDEPQIQQFKKVQTVNVNYWTNLTTLGGTATLTDANVSKGETITVTDNTPINTLARANAVCTYLQTRRNDRDYFTIDYRGNPALELEDYIQIQNRYVANQKMWIHKHEMTYEGYLSGRLEGRAT